MPTWGYRLKDGEIEARVFDNGKLPRGWHDSPAKVKKNGNSA